MSESKKRRFFTERVLSSITCLDCSMYSSIVHRTLVCTCFTRHMCFRFTNMYSYTHTTSYTYIYNNDKREIQPQAMASLSLYYRGYLYVRIPHVTRGIYIRLVFAFICCVLQATRIVPAGSVRTCMANVVQCQCKHTRTAGAVVVNRDDLRVS